MSHTSNDLLLERAAEVKTYFEGTVTEKVIDRLVETNDLDELYRLVVNLEADIARQEFNNYDIY